jgi:hypothetical protein
MFVKSDFSRLSISNAVEMVICRYCLRIADIVNIVVPLIICCVFDQAVFDAYQVVDLLFSLNISAHM